MCASSSSRFSPWRLLPWLAVTTVHHLGGQSAPPAPPAASAVPALKIIMSPFEVRSSQDHGYRVGAAITGTGMAGLIKDTPLNISIVSQELVDDQAGNQLVDVLRSASSVALHVKDETQILIRGYTGPQFVNGLPAGAGLTLYDVDRIEIVKGPNAVFAGISNPGGTVNLIKAKPSFTPRHSLDASFGSFAHQRVVLRTSAPLLKDQVAYSFVYGHTDEKSNIDYMFTRERFYSGGLTWKPLPALTFTARYSNLERQAGRRPHTVVSHPLFQQKDREAIQLYDALGLPRPASFPQLENGAVRTAAGQPITTGRTTPEGVDAFIARSLGPNVAPYPGIFSRDFFPNDSFNYNGPDGRDNYRNHTTTLEGEWIASSAFALRSIFQQVDSNRMRREFNGLRPVAGQRLRSSISDFKPGGVIFSARLEAAAKFDLRSAGKHDLLAGFQHDGGKDVISAITVATSRVITYNPRTDPVLSLAQLLRDQYGPAYLEPGVVRKGGGHSNSFYGVLQSSFLDDRLRTLVGGRAITNHRPTDDNRDGLDEDFKTSKLLPQFGALLRVTPALNFYGSISRTFVPQRQQSADLAAIRATQGDPTLPTYRPPAVIPARFLAADLDGRGWELGTKLDLGAGRLLGTLSYFSNEESARLDIDTVNQVLYQLPGGTVRIAAGQTRTKGVETEWVWTPRLNYQVLLSASYFFTKNEISNPSEPREIGSHLESVPRYTINLWNKYTFRSGALPGAYLGGGATALGETYEHPSWTIPIKSAPVVLFDAVVGYATKIGQRPVEVRVNARNLANRHYLNSTFQYGEPRTVIASVGLKF
ncbi:MAG: TonB-dependent receptor [Opitutus sp.]|nr:TonB-dependent receptor [Opitutus sp.]